MVGAGERGVREAAVLRIWYPAAIYDGMEDVTIHEYRSRGSKGAMRWGNASGLGDSLPVNRFRSLTVSHDVPTTAPICPPPCGAESGTDLDSLGQGGVAPALIRCHGRRD
jgi:hypothetical protein